MKKDLEFLTKNLIAHRGMHSKKLRIPENSIPAFKRAIAYGHPIELDIHILKDNNIVVIHDNNLKRMTGVDKDLKDTTYAEIKKLKLDNTNNHIPLLTEVLKLVNGKVPLLIETKFDTKCGVLENRFLDMIKDYKGNYAIQSFNPFSIRFIHKKNPNIKIGLLFRLTRNKNKFNRSLIKPFIKYDFISSNLEDLDSNFVKRNRKSKVILGWTVKDKKELIKYKNLCDNFVCNNLDELTDLK